jgi:hypothetical protein
LKRAKDLTAFAPKKGTVLIPFNFLPFNLKEVLKEAFKIFYTDLGFVGSSYGELLEMDNL